MEYATYNLAAFANKTETWLPVPSHLVPNKLEDKLPYQLGDGTIGSWLALARRIGENKELQDVFYRLMYMGKDSD